MTDIRQTNEDTAVADGVSAVFSDLQSRPLPPGLYVVATPIGNLGDITLRALSVLARADAIACEDTRHTRKLTSHYGIRTPLTAYHDHNAERARPKLLSRIAAGDAVALVSDAGTPLISDPGHKLVREALEGGHLVSSIPGPSAALAALTSAGLATDRFVFEGFLPPKQGARRKRIETLADLAATLVFYEAPSRLIATLDDMAEILGNREAVVAKELTKIHERVERGPISELPARFSSDVSRKGEFVILVSPATKAEITDETIRRQLEGALQSMSARDAVRYVTDELKIKRGRVYRIALTLTDQSK